MKAIALLSGGLDSTLAAKVIHDQGIEVVGLFCIHPFLHNAEAAQKRIQNICQQIGIELKTVTLTDEMLEIIKHPRYGHGSHINPCIDCHILFLVKAKLLMQEIGASFVVTGEVAGQRPMSQNYPTLELIEKQCGLSGYLVRPLSAQHLAPTEPEKQGWIDRSKLLGISGRGRKDQFALAQKLDITGYSAPGGGCLLTYEGHANKIKDLIAHNEFTLTHIETLRVGRHFRISSTAKLVVGKDENDNKELLKLARANDVVIEPPPEGKGPVGLLRGALGQADLEQSCKIIGRYCKRTDKTVLLLVRKPGLPEERKEYEPFEDAVVKTMLL